MTTPAVSHASSRLVVLSFNGRCRRFDLDGDGRLSFAHIARVFRIPLNGPDDCDAWTLDDTSLRIDKSDSGALLTVSALRDLFPLPSGTADQPLVLRIDDGDAPEPAPSQPPRHARKSNGTPGKALAGPLATTTVSGPSAAAGRRRSLTSPSARGAAAALPLAAAGPGAAAGAASPLRAGMVTPRPRHAGGPIHPGGPGYETPGAVSPLRGVRTPLGTLLGPQSPSGRLPRRLAAGTLELAKPVGPDSELLRHPSGQGTFYFSPAASQHLPMLMACHLPPPLQRLLRHFTVAAQCVITARAMVLYARTSDAEYFRDQRLEAALTEARSRNPPSDRYCAYTQNAVRLTGRKRKAGASPHPNGAAARGGGAHTPLTARDGGGGGVAVATPPLSLPPAAADVDMDAGGWAFVGSATLHCPGGAACRKSGRHENWLLSDGPDSRVTYLPVLYDDEEHSAVLLPLADPRVDGGAGGPPPLVWFRYEYESRGGRRGNNFWDRGLQLHLEQAVRDLAGEEALGAPGGGP